ncbi:DUF2171 domain-containing protein [Mesorhizobium onobrychidis]|uniref:DUF2171 domain-containing protein n=1 Tax=Mesorhizobium onobrychidis TaxID=2775404 RepID=A0ABY5QT24_9HYPH|nr:DUF2171 domain-containing protein [Mesorhizobium onobrychidis]UVC13637.1 DUF2171 domain-containing protein [Mesorhizobium onobrychidis]
MTDAASIREHMEVIGADGVHVGTVDKVEGQRIKLTKRDSGEGAHRGHQKIRPHLITAINYGPILITAARIQRDDQTGNRSPSAGVAAKTPRLMARAMVAPAAA